MSPEERQIARVLFKLKIYQSMGFQFENLFAEIMEYSRPTFRKIRPYGNQGDGGNDGYESAHGRYFQVFSPKNPQFSEYNAIKKAAEDFEEKLIPHWQAVCEVKEYFFVFNDKYHSTFLELEKQLSEIKTKFHLQAATVFYAKDLENEFMCLDDEFMIMILGGIPNIESIQAVDYRILSEVINHVLNTPPQLINLGIPIAPDFEEKIIFNGLVQTGHYLRSKAREAWCIDDYFSKSSNYDKQTLRNYLAGYYAESLAQIDINQADAEFRGDLRFAFILNKIAPNTGKNSHDRLRKDAALVIMAKYFESCDIFEEPQNATT